MGPHKLAAVAALGALSLTAAAPAQAQATGRGTATSTVVAASVTVGSLVDLDLVTLNALATLDQARSGTTENLARNRLSVANANVGGVASAFPPEPIEVQRSASARGEARGPVGDVNVAVPGDVAASAMGATRSDVTRLVTDLQGAASSSVPNGSIVTGAARPLDLRAVYDGASAFATGGSSVDRVSVLGGLATVEGLQVAEQQADAQAELSRGATRELALDRVTVLDMGSVLHLLGIEPSSVPLATLAAMADELGIAPTGLLGTQQITSYGSWTGARDAVQATRDELAGDGAGAACGALGGAAAGLLTQVGVDCQGTVAGALAAVDTLLSDLLGILTAQVEAASLVSLEDVNATVQAVASVSPDGIALTSAQVAGNTGRLKVGTLEIGELLVNLGTTPLKTLQTAWRSLEAKAHTEIDRILGKLGDAYAGIVTVQAAPTVVQRTAVDGDYAVAEAGLALLKAQVTVPATLPDPQDVATLPTTPTTGTTPTTVPSPTTTITLPPTTVTVPAPTTTITLPPTTLPIAHTRDASLRGVVGLASTTTIEVGVLSARAEYTRPGVAVTGGGENRTWNARTGFGTPGSLPRTGAGSMAASMAVFAVLVATAWGLRRLAGAGTKVGGLG